MDYKTSKYNWEAWRDICFADPKGQRTILTRQGYDFNCKTNGFRTMAYMAAKDMGCSVNIEVVDTYVILRFFRSADKLGMI